MRRILVIGSSGSGKSTLARRLAERLGLPAIHLDRAYWKPGWVEPDREEWRGIVAELAARAEWVMDGNFSATMDLRLPSADVVVFLDFPRWRCILRVLYRVVSNYGRVRPDMGDGCPERFDWAFIKFVWDYPARSRAKTFALLQDLRPDQSVVVLRTPAEVRRFEAELPASLRPMPLVEAA